LWAFLFVEFERMLFRVSMVKRFCLKKF